MTSALGLRELKKARLRSQLEDTAIAVFSEEGYSTTPVEEVAQRLEVSPRTVYRYFPSKEDLVFSSERRVHAEALAEMSDAPIDEPPLVSLNRAITHFEQRLVDRRSREYAFHTLVARTPELGPAYLGVMSDLEAQMATFLESRPGFAEIRRLGWSGELLAAALTTAHRIAVSTWIESEPDVWLPSVVRQNFALLTAGLQNAAGWSETARATRPPAPSQ